MIEQVNEVNRKELVKGLEWNYVEKGRNLCS